MSEYNELNNISVSSVRAPDKIYRDEVFIVTIKTTTNATNIGIFDEKTGKALGKLSQSYIDKRDIREWTLGIRIGTKGNRVFDVKAFCDNIWSESKKFNIKVI